MDGGNVNETDRVPKGVQNRELDQIKGQNSKIIPGVKEFTKSSSGWSVSPKRDRKSSKGS